MLHVGLTRPLYVGCWVQEDEARQFKKGSSKVEEKKKDEDEYGESTCTTSYSFEQPQAHAILYNELRGSIPTSCIPRSLPLPLSP